jgi:hypothetical protein
MQWVSTTVPDNNTAWHACTKTDATFIACCPFFILVLGETTSPAETVLPSHDDLIHMENSFSLNIGHMRLGPWGVLKESVSTSLSLIIKLICPNTTAVLPGISII